MDLYTISAGSLGALSGNYAGISLTCVADALDNGLTISVAATRAAAPAVSVLAEEPVIDEDGRPTSLPKALQGFYLDLAQPPTVVVTAADSTGGVNEFDGVCSMTSPRAQWLTGQSPLPLVGGRVRVPVVLRFCRAARRPTYEENHCLRR
ncbi:MAG: hypothetical protein ACYC5O_07475 [Anaerolineae bacterium]